MRLEPLYRAPFTTPESWSVELGGEGQSFLIAEGRCEGRVTGRYLGRTTRADETTALSRPTSAAPSRPTTTRQSSSPGTATGAQRETGRGSSSAA